jgi:hypothetical protein
MRAASAHGAARDTRSFLGQFENRRLESSFWLDTWIAAWCSGRRNHRRSAPADRRHGNAGVNAGRGTDHALGLGQLIAQRATSRRFV